MCLRPLSPPPPPLPLPRRARRSTENSGYIRVTCHPRPGQWPRARQCREKEASSRLSSTTTPFLLARSDAASYPGLPQLSRLQPPSRLRACSCASSLPADPSVPSVPSVPSATTRSTIIRSRTRARGPWPLPQVRHRASSKRERLEADCWSPSRPVQPRLYGNGPARMEVSESAPETTRRRGRLLATRLSIHRQRLQRASSWTCCTAAQRLRSPPSASAVVCHGPPALRPCR